MNIEDIQIQLDTMGIDCLVLFSSDPHLSENPPLEYDFRKQLLNFESSAGTIVITKNGVFLRVDSRYHLAAENAFKHSDVTVIKEGAQGVESLNEWIVSRFEHGSLIAVNYNAISRDQFVELKIFLQSKEIMLCDFDIEIPLDENSNYKLEKVDNGHLEVLNNIEDDHIYILSALDSIAWLTGYRVFNLGYDPIFPSYLIYENGKITIFTDFEIELNNCNIKPYNTFYNYINSLDKKNIIFDYNENSQKLYSILDFKNKIVQSNFKVRDFQIIKSNKEIANIKLAMKEDEIALTKFQNYLLNLPEGTTEFDLGIKIREFHSQSPHYRGESFTPIVGFNSNGAIVHYSAPFEGSSVVTGDGFLLVDCGAHYSFGTTDITRVFPIGKPSKAAINDYNKVLQSHNALANAKFPVGTTGKELDALSRDLAKELGVDYGHGTGHGVGYINCVHEDGVRISPSASNCIFKPGMVVSCEPGFYKKGKYGIRIENLLLCKESTEKGFLCFETLTTFPINLI